MYSRILEDIKQDYYAQNFPNDGQRFVAWYMRNIHLRNMNEAKDCITDGPDDKQIDAIVIDDDKSTIFVIQGKFIGAEVVDGEPIREVLSSWGQLRNLTRLQETANSRLKKKLSEVATALADDYEVVFDLVTTARLTPSASQDLGSFQELLGKTEDFPASLNLVDQQELTRRFESALDRDNPSINHRFVLEPGRYSEMNIGGTLAVVAAIQLKACLDIPGIKDGTLFRKNVRQSLGLNNAVNKAIKQTIYSDRHRDFFFFHNGIAAICNRMQLGADGTLDLHGLSVVNGCQSLNTILSCSERVKSLNDTYVMFRFYEIPQRDRADRISINTNYQSAVKPRDFRSNDRRVLSLKRSFEQMYPQGCFILKRGEEAPASKDKKYVLDFSNLGKYLISWHSQRPNIAYSETKIFDKYFEQLFKRGDEYKPENAQALNAWMQAIAKLWVSGNPIGLNESLLAMKAFAPFHQLYAISVCFTIANSQPDRVPFPSAALEQAKSHGRVDQIVEIAGSCLNTALEAAANETLPPNRVFSPQNWMRAKTCLSGINAAVRQYFSMLPTLPGGKEVSKELKEAMSLPADAFEYRWAAD